MRRFKTVFLPVMLVLISFVGCLGTSGVAVLCIHSVASIHFLDDQREDPCCDLPHEDEALTLISETCDHCMDIRIEAGQWDLFGGPRNEEVSGPNSQDVDQGPLIWLSSFCARIVKVLPPARSPPTGIKAIPPGIETTILRL